jgi:hypothetical protein
MYQRLEWHRYLHCKEISIYVFPEKELRGLSLNFHIYVSVSDLYISTDRSYFPAAEYADRSWEFKNSTQKHEFRNWDCGRAIPFLGIYVSNFFGIVSLQCLIHRLQHIAIGRW